MSSNQPPRTNVAQVLLALDGNVITESEAIAEIRVLDSAES